MMIFVIFVVGKTGRSLMRSLLRLIIITMLLLLLLRLMMMIYWHGDGGGSDVLRLGRISMIAVINRIRGQRLRGRQLLLLRLLLWKLSGSGWWWLVKRMMGKSNAGKGWRRMCKLLRKCRQSLELSRIKGSYSLRLMIKGWEIRRRRRS